MKILQIKVQVLHLTQSYVNHLSSSLLLNIKSSEHGRIKVWITHV